MFPHSAISNIVNTSSTTGNNYYEQAVSLPRDQSFSFHSRPFASDNITSIYNPNPNCTSNSDFIISNSKQDQNLEQGPHHHIHPPLSVYYFPSPFEDYDAQLLQHHEPFAFQEASSVAHHHHQAKMEDWESNKKDQVVTNKKGDEQQQQQQQQQQQKRAPDMRRSSKKDRHSKINTARGPRDRRMRLSLIVARRFFGLQDMLGYDKASKTVEWLLNQAEAEINKVTREYCREQRKNQSSPSTTTAAGTGARTTSASTSECEVVSGPDEAATDDFVDKVSPKSSSGCVKQRMKKIVRKQKKSAMFNPLAKESRAKARARARERTREKQCPSSGEEASGGFQSYNSNNINNYSTLESLTETEEPIYSLQAAGTSSTLIGHHPHIHQDLATVDGHDAAANLLMMGKWSPSSTFNYLQHTSGTSSQEHHQFADFQFYGKPWEVYNSSTHNSHNLF